MKCVLVNWYWPAGMDWSAIGLPWSCDLRGESYRIGKRQTKQVLRLHRGDLNKSAWLSPLCLSGKVRRGRFV